MVTLNSLLYHVFRDLYIVLLFMLALEQIPGNDLLHDFTRAGVVFATAVILLVKFVFPYVFDDSSSCSPRPGPKRQKKTEGSETAFLKWGSSEMQGWRPAMEDATCIVPSLPHPLQNRALFAVFDGHGGSQVSQIASQFFPKVLVNCAQQYEKERPESPSSKELEKRGERDPEGEEALNRAMLALDALLHKDWPPGKGPYETLQEIEASMPSGKRSNPFNLVGSTAFVALVDCGEETPIKGRPQRLTVANCGDSRAVLCRAGKAIELSEDHKPELKKEEERIIKAGGQIKQIGPCHRIDFVQGWGLNLSRALGDFEYKGNKDLPPEEQKVIAVPEICTLPLTDKDEFLLLACDGIFELHSSQEAINTVRRELQKGAPPWKAAEQLLDMSCSDNLQKTRGRGGDNCSAIVLCLKR